MIKKTVLSLMLLLMTSLSYGANYYTLEALGHELKVSWYRDHGNGHYTFGNAIGGIADYGIITEKAIITFILDKNVKHRVWTILTLPADTPLQEKSSRTAYNIDCDRYMMQEIYGSLHNDFFGYGESIFSKSTIQPYEVIRLNSPIEWVAKFVCKKR